MRYKMCASCGKHVRESDSHCWKCQSTTFLAELTDGIADAPALNNVAPTPATNETAPHTMYCRECGSQISHDAAVCMKCGVPTKVAGSQSVQTDMGQDAITRMLLPVGRSGYAIGAGYLGLFSLLIVPAPLALLFGIIAVVHLKGHPSLHGMGRAVFGIVMGTLGTTALVAIFLAR
jgi:hypothetical protein